MAKYLNTDTKEYPRHQGDLELLGWSVGEPLPENWVEVQEVAAPETLEGEIAIELAPKLVDETWIQQWKVHTFTEEELAIIENQKLKLPWEKK